MSKWTAHYSRRGVAYQRDFDWFADAMNFLRREMDVVPLGVSVVGGQVFSYGDIVRTQSPVHSSCGSTGTGTST